MWDKGDERRQKWWMFYVEVVNGSSVWVCIRIPWGPLGEYACLGPRPKQIKTSGVSPSHLVLKLPRWFLMCFQGWECSRSEVNKRWLTDQIQPTTWGFFFFFKNFFKCFFLKYILLIMLLQLSHFFFPFSPSPLNPPSLQQSTHLSSCPWVIHISSLASPIPILFF